MPTINYQIWHYLSEKEEETIIKYQNSSIRVLWVIYGNKSPMGFLHWTCGLYFYMYCSLAMYIFMELKPIFILACILTWIIWTSWLFPKIWESWLHLLCIYIHQIESIIWISCKMCRMIKLCRTSASLVRCHWLWLILT